MCFLNRYIFENDYYNHRPDDIQNSNTIEIESNKNFTKDQIIYSKKILYKKPNFFTHNKRTKTSNHPLTDARKKDGNRRRILKKTFVPGVESPVEYKTYKFRFGTNQTPGQE